MLGWGGFFKNDSVGMGWFKNNVGMGWFKNNNVGMGWFKNNDGMGWFKNNTVKEGGTLPARINLCTPLIAVSIAVQNKVTKTMTERQQLRNDSGGTKSQRQCPKSNC